MKIKAQLILARVVVVSILVFMAGCATTQPTGQETITEPNVGIVVETTEMTSTSEGKSISWAGYTPKTMDKMHVTEVAIPTGNKSTSAILVHEVMPLEVLRGGTYTYEYHVTNLTDLTHQNVIIKNEAARNLVIVSSTPAVMEGEDGSFMWTIGDLAPRETKVVRVQAISEVVGTASDCVSVDYENSLCALTKVVDPDLLLIKTAATDGTVCDDFWFTYEVVNPGSGMAKNTHIRDEIPSGLRTVEGNSRVVDIAVGDLAPGERKKFTVKAKGVETGRHHSIAVATADGGLISESESIETIIYQPVLTVVAEGPARQYIGRSVNHTFVVQNQGDTVAENTVVTAVLPGGGATVVGASHNGTVTQDKATWQLGALGMDQSQSVSVKLKATEAGTMWSNVSANAVCAAEVVDRVSTTIIGIPAVLLELIDSGDPVEVGGTVTYTVTVTNQGSAPDSNVVIVAQLPVEQEYLSSDGPTQGTLRGRTLRFAPVSTLLPGAKAQWQIQARGVTVGDVRFGVTMTSDQLSVPVKETEATTIY
jgi:uncharacterized repeat protein (TIGR01451 family)